MPKAYLAYDLDDYDEREYHKYALTALDVRLAVMDFDEHLRKIVTYGEDADQEMEAEEVRTLLADCFEARDVDWEVI